MLDVTPNELLGIERNPKGVMEKFQKLGEREQKIVIGLIDSLQE